MDLETGYRLFLAPIIIEPDDLHHTTMEDDDRPIFVHPENGADNISVF
jgi:hypothetical protein